MLLRSGQGRVEAPYPVLARLPNPEPTGVSETPSYWQASEGRPYAPGRTFIRHHSI